MKGFYRYIYVKNNKFSIIKNNEEIMHFDNIYDALAHRDVLEYCDWDWDCYLSVEVNEDKYLNVDLPSFTHHDLKYIYNEYGKCRGKKPFAIKKYYDGKLKRFGRYRTVDEAIKARDELVECGWVKKREKI